MSLPPSTPMFSVLCLGPRGWEQYCLHDSCCALLFLAFPSECFFVLYQGQTSFTLTFVAFIKLGPYSSTDITLIWRRLPVPYLLINDIQKICRMEEKCPSISVFLLWLSTNPKKLLCPSSDARGVMREKARLYHVTLCDAFCQNSTLQNIHHTTFLSQKIYIRLSVQGSAISISKCLYCTMYHLKHQWPVLSSVIISWGVVAEAGRAG